MRSSALIDPLDFDAKCDGSLPLESILKPDPSLRKLLQDIDRTKVRVWALTNAYVNVSEVHSVGVYKAELIISMPNVSFAS
jgi:hypothetical protein